jgi:hypothetical protein
MRGTTVGRLQGFERRLSGVVNGAVAKVFRGQVQPVEIAQALTDEAESRKVVGASRTLVPNRFAVDLGPGDHARLAPYEEALAEELADIITEHARDERWSFVGPVTVALNLDQGLETGVFRVRADVDGQVPPEPAEPAAPPQREPLQSPFRAAIANHPAPGPTPGPAQLDVISEPELPPDVADIGEAGVAAPAPAPLVQDALQARLEISDSRIVELELRVTRLGRGQDTDVRIDDTAVSRNHAEIRRQADGRHLLADLDSTNGTFVHGERVHLHWLCDGDRVELGAATLTYRTS